MSAQWHSDIGPSWTHRKGGATLPAPSRNDPSLTTTDSNKTTNGFFGRGGRKSAIAFGFDIDAAHALPSRRQDGADLHSHQMDRHVARTPFVSHHQPSSSSFEQSSFTTPGRRRGGEETEGNDVTLSPLTPPAATDDNSNNNVRDGGDDVTRVSAADGSLVSALAAPLDTTRKFDQQVSELAERNMEAEQSTWVTLFGIPPSRIHSVRDGLESALGTTTVTHFWPATNRSCNWVYVQFPNAFDAARAVHASPMTVTLGGGSRSRNGGTNNKKKEVLTFGVEWCKDTSFVRTRVQLEDDAFHRLRGVVYDGEDPFTAAVEKNVERGSSRTASSSLSASTVSYDGHSGGGGYAGSSNGSSYLTVVEEQGQRGLRRKSLDTVGSAGAAPQRSVLHQMSHTLERRSIVQRATTSSAPNLLLVPAPTAPGALSIVDTVFGDPSWGARLWWALRSAGGPPASGNPGRQAAAAAVQSAWRTANPQHHEGGEALLVVRPVGALRECWNTLTTVSPLFALLAWIIWWYLFAAVAVADE